MDEFIDREVQQVQKNLCFRRKRDFFGWMVAVSLLLHAVSSAIVLSPRYSNPAWPSVAFIDLTNMQLPEKSQPIPIPEEKQGNPDPANDNTTSPQPEPVTEAEKLQDGVNRSLDAAASNPESLKEKSFGLGLMHGYFSSFSDGETLKNDIREYYLGILQEINEKWWLSREGQRIGIRGAIIDVVIGRDGKVLQKSLVRSSGNPALDRAMLGAVGSAGPFPPLPKS